MQTEVDISLEVSKKRKSVKTPKIQRPKISQQELRKQFVETAHDYLGVPYSRKYHGPESEMYNSELFLDCCGLVRRSVYDLREQFGFQLGKWNQCYQFDCLPINIEEKDLLPGDLIFYEGIFFDEDKKPQIHNIVHVEISLGGQKTIAAR